MIKINTQNLLKHAGHKELVSLVRSLAAIYDYMNMTKPMKKMNSILHDESFNEIMAILNRINKRANKKVKDSS